MKRINGYKLIDMEDEENYVYIFTDYDIEPLWNECEYDREKLIDELEKLNVDFYVVFPDDIWELSN